MPKRDTLLKIGDKAPVFELHSYRGELMSLPQLLKQGKVLVLFFRGTWCPNCRKQLLNLTQEYQSFLKSKLQLIGIVCQDANNVKLWAEENKIPFPLLIDVERKIAKDYGVYVRLSFDSINIARPANFLIDTNGIVKFVYVSSHQWNRAATSDLLAQAQS